MILNQAYDMYHASGNADKSMVRMAALNLAKSAATEIARYMGIPDMTTMAFSDQLEALLKELDELRQKNKVQSLTTTPAS